MSLLYSFTKAIVYKTQIGNRAKVGHPIVCGIVSGNTANSWTCTMAHVAVFQQATKIMMAGERLCIARKVKTYFHGKSQDQTFSCLTLSMSEISCP